MTFRAYEVYEAFKSSGVLKSTIGPDTPIKRIAPIEDCGPGDLVFLSAKDGLNAVRTAKPSAVVTNTELAAKLELPDACVLIAPNVHVAHALVRQKFADRDVRSTEWAQVHPSSVVHESVKVPKSAVIGPLCVIGRDVQLGENVVIMAQCVVEHGAKIGSGTVIHPGCVIGYDCEIGSDCIIRSGTIVGSEGFGFSQDEKRKNYRVPQTGRVVIEDRVVLGANNCVDRASYQETRIKSGVVFDNLCHVAHNVLIDEDCIIVAQSGIAGSSKLGKRVLLSGQCGVIDHVNIADDVILVHRAAAYADVEKPGVYAWLPLLPVQDYLKTTVHLKKLGDMAKKISSLEKRVAELSAEKKPA